MFVWNACFLIAAAGFITEVPETIRAMLSPTNETSGTFVQTKTTPEGKAYVTKGEFRIRPGVDFTWKTVHPFETSFCATPTNYVYSNEDESVEKKLEDLPGFSRFEGIGKGDFTMFFKAFDSLYTEEDGKFYMRSRPKASDLKRVLSRIDVEGVSTNWTLRAELPDKTVFSIQFFR